MTLIETLAFYTSFVGRRALLNDVREHLASSRVVTLVGPGGVGKTRIAGRVVEEARATYRDGCWVVSLADLVDPDLLSAAVAEALGLQVTDRPWRVDTLADHLAERTALLVLDNCEHLVAAVVELVVGLRARCSKLTFLLTSRRPLRLAGESVIVVPPLSHPDQATVATPESIAHYEAVRLFLDRATSARSDFTLTSDNAPAIAELCRELEGVPLAIELAAARTRVLSAQEIRDRLAERLAVLNLGYRDAEARHQTLRACVEWSYDLCTPMEQRFWARSSVFAGGYDLEGVAAVCGADDLSAEGVLDLVSELVDQSVVLAEVTATGQTRYRMLTDIRDFGLERAEKDGELQGLQQRHSRWYDELVARFDRDACGPHQIVWLHRLRLEQANLRTAIAHHARALDEAAAAVSMARQLDLYWSASGLLDEARHWLEIGLASGTGTPQERSLAIAVAARFAVLQHDRRRARELIEEGMAVATSADDPRTLGLLLVPTAMLSVWEGTPTVAAEQADRAVALLTAESPRPGELLAWFVAGVCHGFAGHPVEAADRHRQCIARADEVGEQHMKALAVAGLGEQELAGGRLQEATVLFAEALILKQELGDRRGMAVALDSLGRVATAEGRGERAALLLGAAEGVWDVVGMSETGNPFAFAPSRSDGLQQARRLLGKQRFRELFRRGSRLGLDDAVRFALDAEIDEGPRPARTEPSPLTKREREVADLVAEGLSNPQIAARLVISVRTAQGHVENILRKLGFSSRSMIAAWVTQRRLAEQAHLASP